MDIGKKLREYRVMNDLTQEELASRCELSKGFLSQIENDLTSPSISTLNDIVEALGIDLATFFTVDKEEQVVFTEEDYFIDEQEDLITTWIVPNAQKNMMEPVMLRIKGGSQSQCVDPFEGEAFGFILEGHLTLSFGDESLSIEKGETFYLEGNKSHYLKNETGEDAVLIWVSTPPIF
ncbi:helix-turn-helix domain-containing protein [Erysipelothrix urinaevulpis]|uniref:helix-turn-helix domain-containing protein n=1 Tax=Erysipelothrix urinaevulpis TaxID=2683717 RepID=UPI00135929B2|nr:helix-turn-helix domain-containing protein [Erysipelothrix urinaevulpis]